MTWKAKVKVALFLVMFALSSIGVARVGTGGAGILGECSATPSTCVGT